jgi:hypothetical protein
MVEGRETRKVKKKRIKRSQNLKRFLPTLKNK